LRYQVFVNEQNVPLDLEQDGLDDQAMHVVVFDGARCVGTGRLMKKAEDPTTVKVQRVAVDGDCRGKGVGRAVMDALEARGRDAGHSRVLLASQASAVGFYERLGYRAFGDMFMDAGIEHYWMDKAL